MKIFLWPGMKIGYYSIHTSISRKLNWTSKDYQLDGAVRSRHAIWAPPVVSRGKTAGWFILFRYFWNMEYVIFYSNCRYSQANVTQISAGKDHFKRGIPRVCGGFSFLYDTVSQQQYAGKKSDIKAWNK